MKNFSTITVCILGEVFMALIAFTAWVWPKTDIYWKLLSKAPKWYLLGMSMERFANIEQIWSLACAAVGAVAIAGICWYYRDR